MKANSAIAEVKIVKSSKASTATPRAAIVNALKLASLITPNATQSNDPVAKELYSIPISYNSDPSGEVLSINNFVMPVSEANTKEHTIRQLSLTLSFTDEQQISSEQTHTFYKVPDCYILLYCPSQDHSNQTIA